MKKVIKVFCTSVITACILACAVMPAAAGETVSADITWPDMFGDQDGVLTLDPEAMTWALTFENPYGVMNVSGTYDEEGTMVLVEDNGQGQFLPLEAINEVSRDTILKAQSGELQPESAPAPSAPEAAQGPVSADITWPDMFGDQDGVLTLDPEAMTWALTFENPYGVMNVSGTYDEEGTMVLVEDNGQGQFLPLEAINEVSRDTILKAQSGELTGSAASDVPAAEEETPASDDFDAFKTIVTWDVLDFPTVFEMLPDAYNTYDTPNKGTDFFIEYTTDVYGDGVTYDKFARVYLPYGYDPEDKETKYNVLYLQHGNNCSPSNFFDLTLPSADFKKLLDNLFDPEHGVLDPFIIVCPTYYLGIDKLDTTVPDDAIAGDGRYEGIPGLYYQEVIEDLIPAVESQLNVYCEDFTPEGIAATRDHRAWGGYSRGSQCTWYMFHHNLEYFRYWMPTSAPCRSEGIRTGDGTGWEDSDAFSYLKEAIDAHPDLPFFILAQSGGENDAATMRPQMKFFADQKDTFSYGMNPEKNNFYYTCSDLVHVQQYFAYYMYTAKDILFK